MSRRLQGPVRREGVLRLQRPHLPQLHAQAGQLLDDELLQPGHGTLHSGQGRECIEVGAWSGWRRRGWRSRNWCTGGGADSGRARREQRVLCSAPPAEFKTLPESVLLPTQLSVLPG